MKLLIILFVLSTSAFSAGIKGSKHDFSKNVWSEGEICKACHIPHGANSGSIDAPL